MFLARLRLESFDRGIILPHEQTFGGPKEDRLALMKATACQLSPIFGLYADPVDQVGKLFAPIVSQPPAAKATLSHVENRVWVVSDRDLIDRVASTLADRKVYIADGHHRYGTALMYRDWCTEKNGEPLNPDDPANFVMFVLASMDDPGCLILPYCRAIGETTVASLLDAWKGAVEVLPDKDPANNLTLHDGETGQRVSLRFARREMLRKLEPGQVEPWYDLDYAYLHRYLIDELLADKTLSPNGPEPQASAGARPRKQVPGIGSKTPQKLSLHYVKSTDEAIEAARLHNGVALLTNATPMKHLRAMSEAGGLMPQKSTYFHPKLATGIAINPLS